MGKFSIEKPSEKISKEDAEKQFMLFIESYNIDLDKAAQNLNGKSGEGITSEDIGNEYVEMIQFGYMSVEDVNGTVKVIQHLDTPQGDFKNLTFGKMTGRVRKAMGTAERDGNIGMTFKMCAMLIEECSNDKLLLNLEGKDPSNMTKIGNLFLLF